MDKGYRTNKEHRMRAIALGVTMAATGALALVGCSSGEGEQTADTPVTTTVPIESVPSTTTTTVEGSALIFDGLGGGSTVIQVYPGVTETADEQRYNGTFNSGDQVVAECKTNGRVVESNPAVGELDRSSNQWIRIEGTPDETQYATAVYIQNPEQLLSQLPEC